MKCSLIIPVFESYEVVRRQILYMNTLNLPKDKIEIIFIDDGSRPSIFEQTVIEIPRPKFNMLSCFRGDYRAWTKPLAINAGVQIASGDYIWTFAIDHIITQEAVDFIIDYDDCMRISFLVKYGKLDKDGKLVELGTKKMIGSAGIMATPRKIFIDLGGYNGKLIGIYPSGDDLEFNDRYEAKHGKMSTIFGPHVYAFPKDEEVDVAPFTMDDQITEQREKIFYNLHFQNWKKQQYEEYSDYMKDKVWARDHIYRLNESRLAKKREAKKPGSKN